MIFKCYIILSCYTEFYLKKDNEDILLTTMFKMFITSSGTILSSISLTERVFSL